jgi:hypothetical protein
VEPQSRHQQQRLVNLLARRAGVQRQLGVVLDAVRVENRGRRANGDRDQCDRRLVERIPLRDPIEHAQRFPPEIVQGHRSRVTDGRRTSDHVRQSSIRKPSFSVTW